MGAWQKLGLLFSPDNQAEWFVTHAALPTAEAIDDDILRVYFSGRDEVGRAQIGYFDCELEPEPRVLRVSNAPIICFGEKGLFDDRGVVTSCLIDYESEKYLYYTGWMLGVTVPFYFYIGLAIAPQGTIDFVKHAPVPIMDRNSIDPYLLGSPFILVENDIWRMWYVSAQRWEQHGDGLRHYYLIKYAWSEDGLIWHRDGHICIDFSSDAEYALARPHVIKEDGYYHMWYAYRGDAYRIGYAVSEDGLNWERRDSEVGIDVSESGWDSEMIEYPYIFDHQGKRYMLYNGNGYGKTGIGLAVWRE